MVASQEGLKPAAWSSWVFPKVLGQAVPLFRSPHHLAGWLGTSGPLIPDPSPVTVPLPPGRRGGRCGCRDGCDLAELQVCGQVPDPSWQGQRCRTAGLLFQGGEGW